MFSRSKITLVILLVLTKIILRCEIKLCFLNIAGFVFICHQNGQRNTHCEIQSPSFNINETSCLLITLSFISCPSDIGALRINAMGKNMVFLGSSFTFLSRSNKRQYFQVNLKQTYQGLVIYVWSRVGMFLLHSINVKGGSCFAKGRCHTYYF